MSELLEDSPYARQKAWREANRDEFNTRRRAQYARRKEKSNAYSREYYAKNRDRLRAKMKEWAALKPVDDMRKAKREWVAQDRVRNRAKHLWYGAKRRAQARGLDFTIQISDIQIPEFCPVLGIPIVIVSGVATQDGAPSLDRIDNSLGYTVENVRVISYRANAIKRDMTRFECELLLRNWNSK